VHREWGGETGPRAELAWQVDAAAKCRSILVDLYVVMEYTAFKGACGVHYECVCDDGFKFVFGCLCFVVAPAVVS
jgi:hypothetical protein